MLSNTNTSDIFVKSTFVELSANTSTTSLTFVDLISAAVIVNHSLAQLAVFFTASFTATDSGSTAGAIFQLLLDGVTIRKCAVGFGSSNGGPGMLAKITYVISNVAAGQRIVKIQWLSNSGGTVQIRPVTTINESASMNVIELIG